MSHQEMLTKIHPDRIDPATLMMMIAFIITLGEIM